MAERTVTFDSLASFLAERKGSQFVTVLAVTEPKTLKKNRNTKEPNPFPGDGQILKHTRVRGIIGFQYSNSVNNQRAREDHPEAGEFVAESRAWGERIPGTPLVSHKGKLYLEIKVEHHDSTRYYDRDGNEIPYDDAKPFLPKRKEESSRQETDKPIILRDFGLSGIRELACAGEKISVTV